MFKFAKMWLSALFFWGLLSGAAVADSLSVEPFAVDFADKGKNPVGKFSECAGLTGMDSKAKAAASVYFNVTIIPS